MKLLLANPLYFDGEKRLAIRCVLLHNVIPSQCLNVEFQDVNATRNASLESGKRKS